MSTVQVDEEVKKKLFSYAARLQEKSGRKVSLSDAIDTLLDSQNEGFPPNSGKERMLSMYGILEGETKVARRTLQELRQSEERIFERRYPESKRKSRA